MPPRSSRPTWTPGLERGDWQALDALATRVLGTEEDRPGHEDPIAFEALSDEQLKALKRALFDEHPQLAGAVDISSRR